MYYYIDGQKIDVFGYDPETETYDYSLEGPAWGTHRAKRYYKQPDKRNPWYFEHGYYIYILLPGNKKKRLFIDK